MTKRPLAYIGLSMLVAFSVVFYFGLYGAVFILVSAGTVGLISLVKRSKLAERYAVLLICISLVLSVLYSVIFTFFYEQGSFNYDEQTVRVKAAVIAKPEVNYDIYGYELKSSRINGKAEEIKILFKSRSDLRLQYADEVSFNVLLKSCDNNYYKSRGFNYYADPASDGLNLRVKHNVEKGIGYLPVLIKEKLTHAVSVLIGGSEGELCNAIAIGDRFGLSEDLYSDFSGTGMTYIIVVSGMHMSIVAAAVLRMLKLLFFGRLEKLRYIIAIIFVWLFALITGFAPSALRSAAMLSVILLSRVFRRIPDPFTNMGIAAILLTVLNPMLVGDVGVLLSFASVLGILVFHPKLMNRFNLKFSARNKLIKILRFFYEAFSVSFSAVLAITPLSLVFFGVSHLLVIVLSVLISFVIEYLMIFTLLCAVLWYAPVLGVLSYSLAFAARLMASVIIALIRFVAGIPFLSLYTQKEYMRIWLGMVIVIFVISMLSRNKRRAAAFSVLLSIVLLGLSYSVSQLVNNGKLTMNVMNSGRGTCAYISGSDGIDVISCGGSNSMRRDCSAELLTKTGTINLMLVPTANPYDCRYASDFLCTFDVKSVLLYYRYNTNERTYRLARQCPVYNEFSENESVTVNLVNGVRDTVLNINNHTWQYIDSGSTTVLVAPKFGKLSEIPEKYHSADVLVTHDEFKGIGDVSCKSVIWTSDKPCPEYLDNTITTGNGSVSINLRGKNG